MVSACWQHIILDGDRYFIYCPHHTFLFFIDPGTGLGHTSRRTFAEHFGNIYRDQNDIIYRKYHAKRSVIIDLEMATPWWVFSIAIERAGPRFVTKQIQPDVANFGLCDR